MADKMDFPDTVEEFMEQYKVVDTDGVYMSKGSELVPIFRMRQWFEQLPSAQTDLITKIQNGIKATDADDVYSCGMRNGMRWCISLIDDKEPLYENCPSAQPDIISCKECKYTDGCEPIGDGRYWCCLHGSFMYYCSDAERRTDGTE